MPEELLEPLLRKFRIRMIRKYLLDDAVLCDVGCGNGIFLQSISPYIKAGYGFDKKVVESSVGNIHLKKVYLDNHIPLDDGMADCVTLLAVFEHLDQPADLLRECHRIMKPGGRILITTPSPMSKPLLEFLSFRLNIVSPVEIRDHKHYYSKVELTTILGHCGFTNLKVKSFEFGLNNFAEGIKP